MVVVERTPFDASNTLVGKLPETTAKVAKVGKLVAVTLKLLAAPETKVATFALVNVGASFTVRVRVCTAAAPTPLETFKTTV